MMTWLLLFGHSVISDSATSWIAECRAPLSSTISQSLLKFMYIELVVLSNHFILCNPLVLLPFPTSVFPSESVLCIKWPKYWSFSVSPSNEYSGLISFRIDWFDLVAGQRILKSLLQHNFPAGKGLSRVFSSTIQKQIFFFF